MSQSEIIAPILSYDDINKRAEDFLREHKRNEILPVDIEAIAEFDLGLNIFPFPNLQETFDVEGFISGDLNVIYVDEFIYYQRPARYRFTLAHEIGHYIFHSDLIASFHPQSVADWSKFVLGIDEETYGWGIFLNSSTKT
jgi:Zn-dependent peptidase ImmA (M78 family)